MRGSTKDKGVVVKTRYFSLIVACAAALSLLGLPALKVHAKETSEITVGGKTAPIIAAYGKGWFKNEGLGVKLVEISDFMKYPAVLVSGDINLFDGYLTPGFWNMIAGGADFKIVSGGSLAVAASGKEPARNIRGYIIRKDLVDNGTIKSIQDLKGRKVADFSPVAKRGREPVPRSP